RVSSLVRSIRHLGLQPERPDYDAKAVFLIANAQWRWLSIGGGMHRVPIAAGLGASHVPVRITSVVRREEADIWPQVVSGLYDLETALQLFDRLYEGRAPACAEAWMRWVDRQGYAAPNRTASCE